MCLCFVVRLCLCPGAFLEKECWWNESRSTVGKNVAKILMSYSAVVESTESKKKVTKKTVNL